MFRGIAPTERGGYSLREMAQQRGPLQYFNSLLEAGEGARSARSERDTHRCHVPSENSNIPDTFTIIKQGPADSDGDGIPDEYEIAHGLNRFDPADALLDSDSDRVSNPEKWHTER